MFIYSLLDIPDYSVIALLERTQKKIYIRCTKSTMNTLAKLVKQLKDKVVDVKSLLPDKGTLEFIVLEKLETSSPKFRQKERLAYWMNFYKEAGYELYNKQVLVKYKLGVMLDNKYKVVVSLYDLNNVRYIVGKFSTEKHASLFIKRAYPDINNIRELIIDEEH